MTGAKGPRSPRDGGSQWLDGLGREKSVGANQGACTECQWSDHRLCVGDDRDHDPILSVPRGRRREAGEVVMGIVGIERGDQHARVGNGQGHALQAHSSRMDSR